MQIFIFSENQNNDRYTDSRSVQRRPVRAMSTGLGETVIPQCAPSGNNGFTATTAYLPCIAEGYIIGPSVRLSRCHGYVAFTALTSPALSKSITSLQTTLETHRRTRRRTKKHTVDLRRAAPSVSLRVLTVVQN